jgi:hypothetical protein
MTPGKAVGFLFIPLFNLYWMWQVFYGWAKDYNLYVGRHRISAPVVSENIFLGYVLSTYVSCVPVTLGLLFVIIKTVCRCVNSLSTRA